MNDAIAHLVFDVESVADGPLIASARYPGEGLTPEQAVQRYQEERLEQTGSTFIPHTFMVPIAVVIAKVDAEFRLLDIVSLDEPQYRPHVITKHFWQGWEAYHRPQWVTFNGRSFDIPLMELAAYRYGHPIPKWFQDEGYKSARNRFSTHAHLDLQELLTNFGAARFNGGLNLAAQMLGKPGKMGLCGDQVQSHYDDGNLKAISDYCRCDVLDTYFVFLRTMVLTGRLPLDLEFERVAEAKTWIERQSETCQACTDYLSKWGEWQNPWVESPAVASTPSPAPTPTSSQFDADADADADAKAADADAKAADGAGDVKAADPVADAAKA